MNRYILIILLSYSALLWAADNQNRDLIAVSSSTEFGISLSFTARQAGFQPITTSDGNHCTFAAIAEGRTWDDNRPILPALSRFVVVPPQAGLRLEVHSSPPRIIRTEHPPEIQPPHNQDQSIASPPSLTGLYPDKLAEMSDPVIVRGVRFVKVTTYPVHYNATDHTFRIFENIEVDIEFTPDEPINPVIDPVTRHHSPEFLKYIRSLTINGDIVGRDDPIRNPKYLGHYLVVYHENLQEWAAPFIEWRRKQGYRVDLLRIPRQLELDPASVKTRIQAHYDDLLENGEEPFDHLLIIGDYNEYSYGPNAENIIKSFTGNTIWGQADHADYLFACLEGDDHYPDVAFGRLPSGPEDLLKLAIGRTLAYEAYPYMDDPDWFGNTAVYLQHWGNSESSDWHNSIAATTSYGLEVLKSNGFEDISLYEDYAWDQQGARVGPFLRDIYNSKYNLLVGRAQNYFWRSSFQGVNANTVFPIELNLATHSFTAQVQFRSGSVIDMKGPVAITTAWGYPSVVPYNAVWMEMVKAILMDDMTIGWGRNMGITAFEKYLPNFQWNGKSLYLHVKTDTDYFGDPGLHPWIGIPRVVEIDCPEIVSDETRTIEVHITSENEPVENVIVSLYISGANLPDFDHPDYATYDGMYNKLARTSADGLALFSLDDYELSENVRIRITASGRDICPAFKTINVRQPASQVDISEYEIVEIDGNNDEFINPGESHGLMLTVKNMGESDVEDLSASVSSPSPWVVIENDSLFIGDLDSGEEVELEDIITVHFSPACPDAEKINSIKPALRIEFSVDNSSWVTEIELNTVAANIIISPEVNAFNLSLAENPRELDIPLFNTGRINFHAFDAQLVSRDVGMGIVEETVHYPSIPVDASRIGDDEHFTYMTNDLVIPGMKSRLMLILYNDDLVFDTLYFDVQLGEPQEQMPYGPDDYGYICFDDTDEGWEARPEYDWIEISQTEEERDFNGTRCLFEEDWMAQSGGESVVVDMPFEWRFYGNAYNSITICSNGFIAMDDQDSVTGFQNWPLDRGIGGGLGMIAPFWDKLSFDGSSDVYYYHDEANARFIIEWYKIRSSAQAAHNFEVILYNPAEWITETGDGNILFQYKNIDNVLGPVDNMEFNRSTSYASVGISSPDGKTGISYTWNSEYPLSCAELEDNRAILFTTLPRDAILLPYGKLYGTVTAAGIDVPLEGVSLSSFARDEYNFMHRISAVTDVDGYWEVNAPVALVFSITASKPGYNSQIIEAVIEQENDEVEVSFLLTHPEFTTSSDEVHGTIPVLGESRAVLTIHNTGNGPLSWSVKPNAIQGFHGNPWDYRSSLPAAQILNDSRISGVAFIDDCFYVAGGANEINYIYVLDREGVEQRRFRQFLSDDSSRYGVTNMAWDGELLWAPDHSNNLLFGFTPEGDLRRTLQLPFRPISSITWDTEREVLWFSATYSAIIAMERNGHIIDELEISARAIRKHGLSYFHDDPDGYNLYILTQHAPDDSLNLQQVIKLNIETSDTIHVFTVPPAYTADQSGSFITDQYDRFSWVYMVIYNDAADDRIDLWQMDRIHDPWFTPEPVAGDVQADEAQDITISFDATILNEPAHLEGTLEFTHDAEGGTFVVPVELDVTLNTGKENTIVTEFKLGDVYPNPFNSEAIINYSLSQNGMTKLALYDVQGRMVKVLASGFRHAGHHTARVDGLDLVSGLYIIRLEDRLNVQSKKVVLLK